MVCLGMQQCSQQRDALAAKVLGRTRASLFPASRWDWEVQPLFSAPDRSRQLPPAPASRQFGINQHQWNEVACLRSRLSLFGFGSDTVFMKNLFCEKMDFQSNQAFLHKILFASTFSHFFFNDTVPFLSSPTLFQRDKHKNNSEAVLIFQRKCLGLGNRGLHIFKENQIFFIKTEEKSVFRNETANR